MSSNGSSLRDFLLRLAPCNPLGRGSLKKSHCGRFTLSSLARFFRHNPRNSSQILRLFKNAPCPSLRADEIGVAIYKKKDK